MPFIEPQDRTQNVELKVKIRPEVKALIGEYAAYLASDEAYVVQEVMRKAIASDRDFQRTKAQVPTPLADAERPKSKQKAVA